MLVFLFHRRPSLYLLAVYLRGMTSYAVDTFLLFGWLWRFEEGKDKRSRGCGRTVFVQAQATREGFVCFQSGSLSDGRDRSRLATCFRCRVDSPISDICPLPAVQPKAHHCLASPWSHNVIICTSHCIATRVIVKSPVKYCNLSRRHCRHYCSRDGRVYIGLSYHQL